MKIRNALNVATTYEYGADGIRVSALHEIDADADGEFESKKLTEYLNDSLSITGYSQVLRQTDYDGEGNVLQTITEHYRTSANQPDNR